LVDLLVAGGRRGGVNLEVSRIVDLNLVTSVEPIAVEEPVVIAKSIVFEGAGLQYAGRVGGVAGVAYPLYSCALVGVISASGDRHILGGVPALYVLLVRLADLEIVVIVIVVLVTTASKGGYG
jgi:hypothetical protein